MRLRPVGVVVATDTSVEAMVAGRTRANTSPSTRAAPTAWRPRPATGRTTTARACGLSEHLGDRLAQPCHAVIEDLIRIYSYDVDFQRKVQPVFVRILYASDDENAGRRQERRPVRFADDRRRDAKFYRYQTTDDSIVDYYDKAARARRSSWCASRSATNHVGFGGHHPIRLHQDAYRRRWAPRWERRFAPATAS